MTTAHVHDWDDPTIPAPERTGPSACRCGQSVWLTALRPQAGWFVLGTHAGTGVAVELSTAVGDDQMPAWERPL